VLEKFGLIKMQYRMITVLDIEGLRGFGNKHGEQHHGTN
jgi:hypothetical protein